MRVKLFICSIVCGATTLTLPDNRVVTVFAATAVMNDAPKAEEISDSVTHLEK